MTSKELVKRALEAWKFPIINEGEHSIMVRYQMSYLQIGSLQEDSNAVAVTLTGIFNAEDNREASLALKTCNELNFNLMQVKLYLDSDSDLVIAAEFFYSNESDFAFLLKTAMDSLVISKRKFINQYQEFEQEDKIAQEFNNELANED